MSTLWSMDEIFTEEADEQKEKTPESPSQTNDWLTWKEIQACFHDGFEYKNSNYVSNRSNRKN